MHEDGWWYCDVCEQAFYGLAAKIRHPLHRPGATRAACGHQAEACPVCHGCSMCCDCVCGQGHPCRAQLACPTCGETWVESPTEAHERYQCPTHGVRRREEVRQAEVDEVCVYVCRACGQIAEEMWEDLHVAGDDNSEQP